MHPYIPHLLEDIAAGHHPERKKRIEEKRNPDLPGVIDEFVSLRQEPGHTLGYYSGLHEASFPPAEQLKNREMLEVCRALRKMMRSWSVQVSLPKGLPVRMMYTLLIKALERRIDPNSSFSVTFAYCSLDMRDCPLEKYCTCLKREKPGTGDPRSNDRNEGFVDGHI